MADAAEIQAYLNSCTVGPASGCAEVTGLSEIHRRVFSHRRNLPKAELVRDLTAFYADKSNILGVWNGLSACEHDFISYIVRYNGREYLPTTVEYAKKHHIALETATQWGYRREVLRDLGYSYLKFLHLLNTHIPGTKTGAFFPDGREMPAFILDVLKTVVGPMRFEYAEYVPGKKDYVICRESRLGDFAAIVRFAGRERLKAKPGTFDLSKAKLAKLSEAAGFEEVCDGDGRFCAPKEAKRNNDFKVAQPLFALAANSGLVEIDRGGNVSPGKNSARTLSLPKSQLAKKLFGDYIRENKIYELHYITYITSYDGDYWIKWHECRAPIIELLKTCPVGRFVRFEDFDKYARIFCGDFFRKLLNCAVMVKGYDFGHDRYGGGYNPDWDECEAQIIRLILSFLSAMGMVDAVYAEHIPRIKYSGDDFCVGVNGFRITGLGAWILGLADTYDEAGAESAAADEGGLLVLPDYSVVISGLKCRIEHETYISKFLTRVSDDENAAVYKLDFQSAVRAYDIGITPQKIKEYLTKASRSPLAGNVARSLDDWQAKAGRVRISSLTVLETDDPLLLEEIRHIKGVDGIVDRKLKNAAAMPGDQAKRAKALIERNGWLVDYPR